VRIEINQYKPELVRRFTRSKHINGDWWKGYTGLTLFGMKILGVSLQHGVVLSDKPFEYKYDNLSIWIHLLTWPIEMDMRWGKRPSNFNKPWNKRPSPDTTK
jgi:hypothetical protein